MITPGMYPIGSVAYCTLPASALPWERVRRAISASFAGFWDWEVATGQVWYSPQVAAMLGYRPEQFPHRLETWTALLHPADRARVLTAISDNFAKDLPYNIDYRLRIASGEYRWFRSHGATFRDANGQPAHMAGSMVDVHDYKRLAEQLREQERISLHKQRNEAIDCLAAGIAHEFNNLLQVMDGYTSFAYEELPDGAIRDDLRHARQAIEQAGGLARRLLQFCRKDDSPPALEIDLNDLVVDLADFAKPLLGEAIELLCRLSEQPLLARMDIMSARQSLLNLCINSRDAIAGQGQITITLSESLLDEVAVAQVPGLMPGHFAVLAVSDNGGGISRETCQRIFDPFFTTKSAGKGLGLGLPAVRSFAQHTGGEVHVYSHLGIGTTIRLYIPIASPDLMGSFEPIRLHSTRPRRTILFAEDDSRVRDVGTRMLESAGYSVVAFSDGESALESYLSNPAQFDLLLLDVVMPGLDGPGVVEAIRVHSHEVPVLFCTGYDIHSAALRTVLESSDRVIEKPFGRGALLSAVAARLEPQIVAT